jgi:hypothetical protein
MLRQAGIHEGRWYIVLNFNFAAGIFGPSEEQSAPGVMASVSTIGLQRELPGVKVPGPLIVDAGEVNPPTETEIRQSSTQRIAGITTSPEQPSSQSQPDAPASPSEPAPSRPGPKVRRRRP